MLDIVSKRLILLVFVSYEAVRLWWWGGNCGVVSFGKTPFFCSSPTTGSIFNCMCSNGVGAVESKTDTKTVTPLVTQAAGLNSPGYPLPQALRPPSFSWCMNKIMNTRYRLIHRSARGGMYYCLDKQTAKRHSRQTRNASEARQILEAKNIAERQPALNQQIAGAYLAGSDSGGAQTL